MAVKEVNKIKNERIVDTELLMILCNFLESHKKTKKTNPRTIETFYQDI